MMPPITVEPKPHKIHKQRDQQVIELDFLLISGEFCQQHAFQGVATRWH